MLVLKITSSLKVETPIVLNCFVNKVLPVTVVIPAKVETPEILTLSNSVCPSTSMPVSYTHLRAHETS